MTTQMRLKPGATPAPGSLWAAPERDIAHSFPEYVRKALVLTQDELVKNKAPEETILAHSNYAKAMVSFIALTVGEGTPATVHEAAKQSGILEVGPLVEARFAKYFWRVVLSAYWKGARMAYTKDQTPVGAKGLADAVDGLNGSGG